MPAAAPYIPMILSATTSLLSSTQQASSATDRGSYEASRLEQNASMADTKAADIVAKGESDAVNHQRKVDLLIGQQRAKMGAQGLDLSSGSALDVQKDTAGLGAEDIVTIKNNAFRQAWGYQTEAQDLRSRATLARKTSSTVSRNSILTGISEAIGTGFQAYTSTKSNTKTEK